MQKEINDENYNVHFPKLWLKTPMIEETIKLEDGIYLVNSRIEICVYQKTKDNYCSVISKDIIFADGSEETILLKYFENIKTYEDVIDLTDDFMNEVD